MVVDDTYYITPHEAALAAVATAMKKARLQLVTLVVNASLGGLLFSAGSILCVALHSDNPQLWENNPGITNCMSGMAFGIGLFYVVIMGADLFNSNILFFSVGLLRRAVSIYDVIVSWTVSLFANLGSTLFVSYLFCHLSGVSSQPLWVVGSKKLVEDKASYSFVQTLLKAIAGNFLVCLAIYLQLMAKPIHVKFIVLVAPIFTFVTCGFTHTVADMTLAFIGMLNHADVSVGKYIWKLLIPSVIGNIIGGFFFSLVVPFYLHLVVVEQDRKRLSLPEYEARDEQPELNVDSRVVRVTPHEEKLDEEEAEAAELEDSDEFSSGLSEKKGLEASICDNNGRPFQQNSERRSMVSNLSHQSGTSSVSEEANDVVSMQPGVSLPRAYTVSDAASYTLSRSNTLKSNFSGMSSRSNRHFARSPPGVFPVRGMGEPLTREKTIQNPNACSGKTSLYNLRREETVQTLPSLTPQKTRFSLSSVRTNEAKDNSMKLKGYNVVEDRPGAKLERAITRLIDGKVNGRKRKEELPRTTQQVFPFNEPQKNNKRYENHKHFTPRGSHIFEVMSKELQPTKHSFTMDEFNRDMARVGVSQKAAISSNNVAGIPNYNLDDMRDIHPPPLIVRNSDHSQRGMRKSSLSTIPHAEV